MAYYRIYGKEEGKSRFKALDLSSGVFVTNLMYATFFNENEKAKAEQVVADLSKYNPDITFELRRVQQ